MKNRILIVIIFLLPGKCFGQASIDGAFSPTQSSFFRAPIGKKVVLTTVFSAATSNWRIKEVPYPSYKYNDSSIEIRSNLSWYVPYVSYFDSLTITLSSDTPRCYIPPWDGISAYLDSSFVGLYAIEGVFYDPNVIGKVSGQDSNYFGTVEIDSIVKSRIYFANDSLAQYRDIKLLSVHIPFSLDDSIEMLYPCYYYDNTPNCYFHPTKPGHYVDTAKLLDPLTNDTISVVLIGDAYDAGVSETPEPQVKLYPNPGDQELRFAVPDGVSAKIEIYNLFGESIYHSTLSTGEFVIDCSQFPAGMYFVSIESNTSRITKKIIIVH